MRMLRDCEFDHAGSANVDRPPTRARDYDKTTLTREIARVNAATHDEPCSGELVATPVT